MDRIKPQIILLLISGIFCFYAAMKADSLSADEKLASAALVKIVADPAKVVLQGQDASLQLLIHGESTTGEAVDLTAGAEFRSLDLSIVKTNSRGVLSPVGDGRAVVEAVVDGRRVQIHVQVKDSQQRRKLNFENDIIPILSRFGCNASGCHGKAEGQNGFKLSVFGFNPEIDHQAITLHGRGRRVFPAAPERSLLLQKACGDSPHGGGVRLERSRPEYETLRYWISSGMPIGSRDDPKVVSIEISPGERRLQMGHTQQLRATATFSDGRQGDVTALCRFQSNNSDLASVDENGLVTAGEAPGPVAVMATYMGQVNVFQAVIPRREMIASYPNLPQNSYIDKHVYRRLQQLNIIPSGQTDDASFLRRIYLDLIGKAPTAKETRQFLADQRAHRRRLLVDELLTRSEFADYWALQWSDLLRVDRQALGHKAAYAQYHWIRESLASGKPMDQFVHEIITAEGPLAENPQGNIFKTVSDPGKAAAVVSQVFLGVRIECAQCHHHPYDRWSQTDYFGMQSFFTPLKRKPSPWGEVLLAEGDPISKHPRSGDSIFAHPLGEPHPEKNSSGDRRRQLADWLVAPENPWFARNLTNRVWAHMMGRGLVEPVDDFRATNPPSNPELLDALAADFVEQGFDLRSLLRRIAASRVYQQSTEPNETNGADEQNYSRALLKRIDAEVLLDTICQTTGVGEKFQRAPYGIRAVQLWDSQSEHDFLKLFGRPIRKSACDCERNVEPSVAQVLHMLNSERIHSKLSHEGGAIVQLVRDHEDDSQLAEELYLRFYSRYPSESEKKIAVEFLKASSGERRQAAEDLAWTMMNSLEFVFNH